MHPIADTYIAIFAQLRGIARMKFVLLLRDHPNIVEKSIENSLNLVLKEAAEYGYKPTLPNRKSFVANIVGNMIIYFRPEMQRISRA